jgi:hypothetical protein
MDTRLHAIHETVLVVVNDGDGSQCGYSYKDRLRAAEHKDLAAFRSMARNALVRERLEFEVTQAAVLLEAYYKEHLAEVERGESVR